MAEKSSGVSSVRNEIAIVAGPSEWGDTRESWLARVCRRVPTVSFRTVKALYYGEITDPLHWAARDIRREAERIEANREASALASQHLAIAEKLLVTDPDFYRAEVARLEQLVAQLRAVDRAGNHGE